MKRKAVEIEASTSAAGAATPAEDVMDQLADFVQQKLKFEQDCIEQLQNNINRKAILEKEKKELESLKTLVTTIQDVSQDASLKEYEEMQKPENQIKFNVGGTVFLTSQQTVMHEESMLKVMISSQFHVDRAADGSILIEREPKHFPIILRHLRQKGRVYNIGIPSELKARKELLEEAQFYAVNKLVDHLNKLIAVVAPQASADEDADTMHDGDDSQMQESASGVVSNFSKSDAEGAAALWDRIKIFNEKHDPVLRAYLQQQRQQLEAQRAQLEAEKTAAIRNHPHQVVKINVGGVVYPLSIQNLVKYPTSLFPKLLGTIITPENDTVFFDRDPDMFKYIVDFLVDEKGNVVPELLTNIDLRVSLLREAKHFQLKALVDKLNPLRYPNELIGEDNLKMKEEEDMVRNLFATNREHPLLDNMYLMLLPVFRLHQQFERAKSPKLGSLPLLFDFENLTKSGFLKELIPPFRTINIVESLDDFYSQFETFSSGLLDGLNWDNVFVAGGSVLGCLVKDNMLDENPQAAVPEVITNNILDDILNGSNDTAAASTASTSAAGGSGITAMPTWSGVTINPADKKDVSSSVSQSALSGRINATRKRYGNGYKDSDLDIFLYGMSVADAESKVRAIYETLKRNSKDVFILRSKNALTFKCSKTGKDRTRAIQIVLRIYKSPAEILMGFDIDSCTVGFDGHEVWALPRARRAIAERINLVDVDRQSKTYELRLFKYAKRGFRVCVPGFDRNLVQKQDLVKNFTHAFYATYKLAQSTYQNCTGLARLLLFEKTLKTMDRIFISYHGITTTYNKAQEFALHGRALSRLSDYCNFYLALQHTPQRCFSRFRSTVGLMKKYSREKENYKPDIVFAINDITPIIAASSDTTTLAPHIEWLTVNPGTQFIGSFNPTSRNFYLDAYSAAEPRGRVQWCFAQSWRLVEYSPTNNELLEAAFMANQDQVVIQDLGHNVGVTSMSGVGGGRSFRVRRLIVADTV